MPGVRKQSGYAREFTAVRDFFDISQQKKSEKLCRFQKKYYLCTRNQEMTATQV